MSFRPSVYSNPLKQSQITIPGVYLPIPAQNMDAFAFQKWLEEQRKKQQEKEGPPLWAKFLIGAGAVTGVGGLIYAFSER